jgi:hypothetical protein
MMDNGATGDSCVTSAVIYFSVDIVKRQKALTGGTRNNSRRHVCGAWCFNLDGVVSRRDNIPPEAG